MPQTTADRRRALKTPGLYSLLPIRAFEDDETGRGGGVMVRTDGCYVAGFQVGGALTYYGDDPAMNEVSHRLDSLLRTIPEQSMRVQFRYEIVENANGIIDRYAEFQRADHEIAKKLDDIRIEHWRKEEETLGFLTRIAAIYLIWDPALHERVNLTTTDVFAKAQMGAEPQARKIEGETEQKEGLLGSIKRFIKGLFSSVSPKTQSQIGRKKHLRYLAQFDSFLTGIESSLKSAGLDPTRMNKYELFGEISRALCPDPLMRRTLHEPRPTEIRPRTAREQLASVAILEETDTYINVNGYLYGCVTFEKPPEDTKPGIIRELMSVGFPVVISTQTIVPDQMKVISGYKSRYKKMMAAQIDKDGNHKVDVNAAVQARELYDIQERLTTGSSKTTRTSITVVFRTSKVAWTRQEHDAAEVQIANFRQKVLQIVARKSAQAVAESLAKRRIWITTLPGLASEDARDLDLLTEHVADLVPLEMPWGGMPKEPLLLWHTPHRGFLPYSPFGAGLENANALICANSGSGKSVLIGKLLLTCSRRPTKVSILERGDSYATAVELMGGEMITMSLDAKVTINPFDLERGQTKPTKDHIAFLKTLTKFMIGNSGNYDADILDGILGACIASTYNRVGSRLSGPTTPLLRDLKDELDTFQQDGYPKIEEIAHVAGFKLAEWVREGGYANLFDRETSVPMDAPWLYFNIDQLKDDPKVELAMSLLIAYATTKRANGHNGERCIVILDECWALLTNKILGDTVVKLFRTARKNDACIWGVSQTVEDFTGTVDEPNPFGGAILATTATRYIGRQKGNSPVLAKYLGLGPIAINAIKEIGMTEKGHQSQFLMSAADNHQLLNVRNTPIENWTMTSMPREKTFRTYWRRKHSHLSMFEQLATLAAKYPHGIAALPELKEEASGEVYGTDFSVIAASSLSMQEVHA